MESTALTTRPASEYLAAVVAVTLAWSGLESGGYFPPAWGWGTVVLAWVAVLAVLVRGQVVVTRAGAVLVGGLAAFTVWELVSVAWSSDASAGMQDVQRDLLYVAAAAAAVACRDRDGLTRTYQAVLAGTAFVALYGLTAWLFPDRLGLASDPHAPGRLYDPVGYWNAQGVVTAIAIVLAFGMVATPTGRRLRVVCAAIAPPLAAALYLTLSRGSILALAAGLIVWLAVNPGRRRASLWLAGLAVPCGTAVLLAYESPSLSGGRYLMRSAHDGHLLAVWLVLLGIASGAVAWAVTGRPLPRRPELPPVDRMRAISVIGVVIVIVAAGLVYAGAPQSLARSTYHAFVGPPPSRGAGSSRVLSVSSNGRAELWRSAWHDFTADPVAGTGAGSFEQHWLASRQAGSFASRWAHSLYLQTLGETGIVGLALLAAALAVPLLAGVRSRDDGLACALTGAVACALLHAGSDWDWQIPTVTLAMIWCASALTVPSTGLLGGDLELAGRRSWAAAGAGAAVWVCAVLGLAGSTALSSAQAAAVAGNYTTAAADAHRAASLQPWSYLPWMVIGQSRLATGDAAGAAAAYATATRRDPDRWDAWLALAESSTGRARVAALRRAMALNGSAWQIRSFCKSNPRSGCPPAGR